MAIVYAVLNVYQVVDSDGDSLEIRGMSLSREGAEKILGEITSRLRGGWTDGNTVFEVMGSPDFEYDSYYIEEYEATA